MVSLVRIDDHTVAVRVRCLVLPTLRRTPMTFRCVFARALTLVTAGIASVCLAGACSGSNGNSGFDNNGGAGNGGGGDDSGTIFGGGQDSGHFGNDGGADANCASAKTIAQAVPLDMYIMLDQSGSMNDQVAGGGTKWSAVTSALTTFVSTPNLNGVSVGLQYFPLPAGNCPTSCQTNTDCGTNGLCVANVCLNCIGGGGDS